jgi:site-specific DNA-methyltransferase (adenine-specific)
VKPYYEHAGVTIYHGDCREVLPHLEKVDLVLTDPPYGMQYQSNWSPKHLQKGGIQNDHEFPSWLFDMVKPRVAMMVWCRWDNLSGFPTMPKSFIAWDKGTHSMGDLKHEFGRQWEGCAFWPGPEHEFINRPADLIRAMRVAADRMEHPTEKPVGAMTPLIKCHPGEIILDPFMGSGTTLVAAKLLNRRAIGIEIEEKYCEIAAQRLAQDNLFAQEAQP